MITQTLPILFEASYFYVKTESNLDRFQGTFLSNSEPDTSAP